MYILNTCIYIYVCIAMGICVCVRVYEIWIPCFLIYFHSPTGQKLWVAPNHLL